ncbi:hypothetical protein PMAYCL1PPCAC_04277 [Pristionchus mayeri]|uniref:Uncharacterized protein n=1 Tax=Pristionchus mayeri TaxID=1317129 RepID=A0AAN5C8R5_9BILA|nr:hypothetical protein PMAYCL1PPCAC_04277 [Pristionchus mayeri]
MRALIVCLCSLLSAVAGVRKLWEPNPIGDLSSITTKKHHEGLPIFRPFGSSRSGSPYPFEVVSLNATSAEDKAPLVVVTLNRKHRTIVDIGFKIARESTLNFAIFSIELRGFGTNTVFSYVYDGLKNHCKSGHGSELICSHSSRTHHIKGVVLPTESPEVEEGTLRQIILSLISDAGDVLFLEGMIATA